MVEVLDLFNTTLKQARFSTTTVRRMVFEALQGKEPLTMHELIVTCKNIDRASIYRTISLFEQLGIVQRLHIGWKYKLELTDRFSHHHHHLTCIRCGQVIPLPENQAIEAQLLALADMYHFAPSDHQLEIRGFCVECQFET